MSSLTASIIITTKNRADELRDSIVSAVNQKGDVEVIVIDDGSDDETSILVANEFPTVRLVTHNDSKGYIVRRNEAAHLASGDILFSIDDDAEFSSPDTVQETLADFDSSQVAAIAIPYIEPNLNNEMLQKAPASGIWLTHSFVGTAYAIRRSAFLNAGCFREALFHQGEEMDLCVRLLESRQYVRLGTTDKHIIHWQSPKRDWSRMDKYGARNSVLFQWQNIPLPYLLVGLLGTIFNVLKHDLRLSHFWTRLLGVLVGLKDMFVMTRAPVSAETYRRWRLLRRSPQLLDELF